MFDGLAKNANLVMHFAPVETRSGSLNRLTGMKGIQGIRQNLICRDENLSKSMIKTEIRSLDFTDFHRF
jgi:hypothetical protein